MDEVRTDLQETARMLSEMGCRQSGPLQPEVLGASGDDLRDRVKKLRETVLRTASICTERGRLYTESYKTTKGDPPPVRQAKALAKILDEMTIFIGEGELLVGNVTSKIRGGGILPELNAQWMPGEFEDFATREWDSFEPLTEGEKETIKEMLSWWEGQSLYDMWRARMPEDKLKYLTNGFCGGHVMCFNGHYLTHNSCDY